MDGPDREVVRAMLTRAGVRFNEAVAKDGDTLLTIDAQPGGEPRHGYTGFYAEFVFRPDGSLRTIGAWE